MSDVSPEALAWITANKCRDTGQSTTACIGCIKDAIERAIKQEREACAKLAKGLRYGPYRDVFGDDVAAAIRAAEIEALEWAASKAEAHAARHHGPEGILHAEMMALGIRNEINDEIARRQKEKP